MLKACALAVLSVEALGLTGCGRTNYLVKPSGLHAAQQAAEQDAASELAVAAVPMPMAGETLDSAAARSEFLRFAALRVEAAPPGAPYWTVSIRRYHRYVTSGGFLLGSGFLGLAGGAAGVASMGVGRRSCDPRDDTCGFGAALISIGVGGTLLVIGAFNTIVGAVVLRKGLQRSKPNTGW